MDASSRILPAVRQFVPQGGTPAPLGLLRLGSCPDDLRVAKAARRLIRESAFPNGIRAEGVATTLHLSVELDAASHADGYRLDVRDREIAVIGGSAAGCFYGLKTLEQLVRVSRAKPDLPCCTILDWPDFDTRGLLHDVTRGKAPTLATLKLLADRLASLKVNQLQLYIEHAFTFAFDPDICDADHGLTPDEIRELDRHCAERFIQLVPAVANLGHMGRILSLPRCRHLAEIAPTKTWDEMSWPERARGFTLDCVNPESFELVQRIWTEILDCFSSSVVNICGDEPWDLGRGRNRHLASPTEIGEAYLAHIGRVHEFCAARGRRTQFWSDVVRNHPDLFDRVPHVSTVLHWGYDDRADYDGTKAFVETGLDTVVCPGTSGWKRIVNAMDPAERNIHTFAAAGHRHGASGLVNTDWGDHGHFNALACSWHAVALGAAHGWRADHSCGAEFDERFAELGWGLSSVEEVALLREASSLAETCETWRLFWLPIAESSQDATFPTIEMADHAADAAQRLRAILDNRREDSAASDLDRRELSSACRFTELFAEKNAIGHARSSGRSPDDACTRAARDFRSNVNDAWNAYAAAWTDRNKPSGLADIGSALVRASADCGAWTVCAVSAG